MANNTNEEDLTKPIPIYNTSPQEQASQFVDDVIKPWLPSWQGTLAGYGAFRGAKLVYKAHKAISDEKVAGLASKMLAERKLSPELKVIRDQTRQRMLLKKSSPDLSEADLDLAMSKLAAKISPTTAPPLTSQQRAANSQAVVIKNSAAMPVTAASPATSGTAAPTATAVPPTETAAAGPTIEAAKAFTGELSAETQTSISNFAHKIASEGGNPKEGLMKIADEAGEGSHSKVQEAFFKHMPVAQKAAAKARKAKLSGGSSLLGPMIGSLLAGAIAGAYTNKDKK